MESLNTLFTIAKVALGLGFVIFVHELGHFLLAKWNGVKVEKFSIGFGPTIFGWTRGETEYVLAALPLGGFVKMLGEGPEEEESKSTDPRAYPNKSVGARMAIISAGVIMNLFLALACFTYRYTREREDISAILGAVSAGSVAYESGLRAGDEIVAIDDRPVSGFLELKKKVALSSKGQVLHVQLKRPGHDGLVQLEMEPRREAGADTPTIGIIPCDGLEIADFHAPTGMPALPTPYKQIDPKERDKKVDVLVAAGPDDQDLVPLTNIFEYERLLARNASQPAVIKHMIERRELSPTGDQGKVIEKFELSLPAAHFVDFGARMEIEPIKEIRKNSPAETAGFMKGDRILKVNGSDDFDPVRLPSVCFENAGKPMTFEVERAGSVGQRRTETLTATPDDTVPRIKGAQPGEPVDVSGLGFCYAIRPRIKTVRPGSPAAKAGLKSGDVINAIVLPPGDKPLGYFAWIRSLIWGEKSDRTIKFEEDSPGWYTLMTNIVQYQPIKEFEVTVNNSAKPVSITPEIDGDWINPWRGLRFGPVFRKLPAQDLATAIRSGYDETIENIVMVYSIFRSLAQMRLSVKQFAGPIMIAGVAYSAASSSLGELIYFLGMLSINLSVLNFLPIPPLDGGQMVFLIAEKVRGRPLPDSALIVGQTVGLIFVLCLMVFVTYQDIFRIFMG